MVKSDIMIGWNRFGSLQVSGHTGNAYRQLYVTLIDLSKTFLMITAVVFALLYLLLSVSLQSLKRIREQAIAIIDNEFIIEKKIPFTTEFRSVTVAMNAMVAKVKDIFERENETLRRYQELLYKDPETKLYNRRYLTAKLPDYLQSHTSLSAGVYVMLSLEGVDRLKREQGYEQDSLLLNALADELRSQVGGLRNSLIARLNESDFFAIIPESEISSTRHLIEHLMNRMREIMEDIDSITSYVTLGCAMGTYGEYDTLKSLFSRADHGVIEAKDKGNFTIQANHLEEETLVLGREEWRHELLESLQQSRMVLAFQSVVEYRQGGLHTLHEEIFLRLLDKEGILHSAGYFIPVATTLGMADTLDRYMIEKVFKHIQIHTPVTPLALNLGCDFVKKYTNIQWLKEQLELFRRHSNLVLWFEVSNGIALNELQAVAAISATVKMLGCRFGIDHFTIPEAGAQYLQIIRPDYIKSNGTYLQDMMVEHDTGKSKESFNNLIRSLGISIVAINIEETQELENLQTLGIERFQGTHIAPVSLLK
jgi:diguanylate cyclase (GGDEF)-like protein